MNLTVTNRKLASAEPHWAPFRGFSILFDNPGNNYASLPQGLSKIHCRVAMSPDLTLYKALSGALDRLGLQRLAEQFSFCSLPPESYHVTVWDGLNDDNSQQINQDLRPQLNRFLTGMPKGFTSHSGFTDPACRSELLANTGQAMQFGFRKLRNFANLSLVAELQPADSHATDTLREIIHGRNRLSATYRAEFGIDLTSAYRPHVTLGYFANSEMAAPCATLLQSWTDAMHATCDGHKIRFAGINLYGFTDMVTFFKHPEVATKTN